MRNLFEHIKRFRDSIARRRDPFRGRLEATADEIRLTDATGVTWSIPWTNIRKIAAFKRDLFTTDVICWELELKEPFRRGWEEFRLFETNEEIEGFQSVVDEAIRRNMVDPHWIGLVMQPAFATCWTVIYDSSVPGSTEVHSPTEH